MSSSVNQVLHSSVTSGHLGANRQPGGVSIRLGGAPGMLRNWLRSPP